MIITLNTNKFVHIGQQKLRHIEVGDFISPEQYPKPGVVMFLVTGLEEKERAVQLAPFWGSTDRSERLKKSFQAIENWHRWEPQRI